MLFVTILTWEPDKRNEIIKRRSEQGAMRAEGIKLIGEWVDVGGGRDVIVYEADDTRAMLTTALAWDDIMKFETFVAMDAEEVMGAIKQ